MKVHKLVQGSAEWNQFRLTHFGASEAAAMLGLSTKVTRTELLTAKKTGIAREFSDFVQEKILDHGHAVEALARPIIERIIGEDLYPVTGSNEDIGGKQSASCDGLTISRKRAFEHKQWNEALAAAVRAKQLPEEHMPQCQQVCKITGADDVIFVVSDGTEENMEYMIVPADPEWFKRLDAGWDQFEQDLQDFVPVAAEVKPVGRAPEHLPALLIEISGQVQASNLTEFHGHAMAVFAGINKDLQTDEDFANAEQTVKWCEGVETKLDAAKQHALAQTASIDELFRTIDAISAEARRVRLDLDKLVKARKEAIKGEIVAEGVTKLKAHIEGLNTRLGKAYMPTIPADFGGVIKNKRSVASIRDAVNTELSRTKIAANEAADRIQTNLNTLRELASDHAFLFSDTPQLVLKANDDLTVLVKSRIGEHQAEQKRKEDEARERIRAEEQAKAEAAAREKLAAEQAEAARVERERIAAEAAKVERIVTAPSVAPAPVVQPGPAADAVTHEAVVQLMPTSVKQAMAPKPAPAKEGPPTMALGEIASRLGFNVTSAFLAELGFEATTVRASKLYHEEDFVPICRALQEHIDKVVNLQNQLSAVAA